MAALRAVCLAVSGVEGVEVRRARRFVGPTGAGAEKRWHAGAQATNRRQRDRGPMGLWAGAVA